MKSHSEQTHVLNAKRVDAINYNLTNNYTLSAFQRFKNNIINTPASAEKRHRIKYGSIDRIICLSFLCAMSA